MTSFPGIAAVISIGLMIGAEFAVWAFINPILWKLEEPARTRAAQLFAQKLGAVMPFWYTSNFLFLVVAAIVLRHRPGFVFLAAASAIWAAVIILTLIFLVPINNRIARQDAGLSLDQSHRLHRRWDTLHRARVVALVVAFALFLLAARP